jgi:hypothetical protein
VLLIKEPTRCTLHHSEPTRVVGKECKVVKEYGERVQGYLKAPKNKTVEVGGVQVGREGRGHPRPTCCAAFKAWALQLLT